MSETNTTTSVPQTSPVTATVATGNVAVAHEKEIGGRGNFRGGKGGKPAGGRGGSRGDRKSVV